MKQIIHGPNTKIAPPPWVNPGAYIFQFGQSDNLNHYDTWVRASSTLLHGAHRTWTNLLTIKLSAIVIFTFCDVLLSSNIV